MRLFQCWRRYKSQPNIIIHKYSKSSAKTSSIKMERKGLREEKKAKKKLLRQRGCFQKRIFMLFMCFVAKDICTRREGENTSARVSIFIMKFSCCFGAINFDWTIRTMEVFPRPWSLHIRTVSNVWVVRRTLNSALQHFIAISTHWTEIKIK